MSNALREALKSVSRKGPGTIQARLTEALVGAALGAVPGAAVGALASDEKKPGEIGQGAAIGALLGSGGSVGLSRLRRGGLTAREMADAPQVVKRHLAGLRELAAQGNAEVEDLLRKRLAGKPILREDLASARDTAGKARRLLAREIAAQGDLLEQARRSRDRSAWGGLQVDLRKKLLPEADAPPHPKRTHEGRSLARYRQMQADYNTPPMGGPDDRFPGEAFWKDLIRKI